MKLVVGLGNPGRKYAGTRHNIGFEVVGELARRHSGGAAPRRDFEAELWEVLIGGMRVLLAAPQTYMNLSGRSVRRVVDFYKLPLEALLVVCDDMNLPPGRLRLRAAGSAGGQKGLKNIIDQLGSEEFGRLRVGIGPPPAGIDGADYVLMRVPAGERAVLEEAVPAAADGVEAWIRKGAVAAMNDVNAPRRGAAEAGES